LKERNQKLKSTGQEIAMVKKLVHTEIADAAAHVLRDVVERVVVVGPLVWQPGDGRFSKAWYFIVSTCGPNGFRADQVDLDGVNDAAEREQVRGRFMLALERSGSCVIHDIGDELDAARLCEQLWPGPKVTELRKVIEAERRQEIHQSG
jgi:hypothetical protein